MSIVEYYASERPDVNLQQDINNNDKNDKNDAECDDKINKLIDERDYNIQKIVESFSICCHKSLLNYKPDYSFQKMEYSDYESYISNLHINPPFTSDEIIAFLNPELRNTTDWNNYNYALMSLLIHIKMGECDGCYEIKSYFIYDNNVNLNNYFNNCIDGLFDIKIHNCTYAYIECSSIAKFLDNDGGEGKIKIEMDKVEDFYTFSDITIKNPILFTSLGYHYEIKTDGKKIELKCLVLDIIPRKVIQKCGPFRVLNFKSKNLTLFAGDLLQPSFVCNTDDIIIFRED